MVDPGTKKSYNSKPNTENTKKIVITAGEPAGIGADICLSLIDVQRSDYKNQCVELYIIVDPELIKQRAQLLGITVELYIHDDTENLSENYCSTKLNIIPLKLLGDCQPGILNHENSAYVLQMLDLACELCLTEKIDAMVTGPVQKSIINEAGFSFTGHTEYLADKS